MSDQTAAFCEVNRLKITNIKKSGGKAEISGVAPASAVGKKVTVNGRWTKKRVGTATVQKDLTFKAKAKLPPSKIRPTNKAHYLVSYQKSKSNSVKYDRRMTVTSVKRTSQSTVTLKGSATKPLLKTAYITVKGSTSCGSLASFKGETIKTPKKVKLKSSGKWSVTLTLPKSLQKPEVFLRAQTTVADSKNGKSHRNTLSLTQSARFGG